MWVSQAAALLRDQTLVKIRKPFESLVVKVYLRHFLFAMIATVIAMCQRCTIETSVAQTWAL